MKMPLVPLAALLMGGVSALAVVALPATGLDVALFGGDSAEALPHLSGISQPLLMLAAGALGAATGALATRWFVGEAPAEATSFHLDPLPTPIIRRADAHPDARPRPPLRATQELDSPAWAAPEIAAEQGVEGGIVAETDERDLPADLDQPLAAFDPLAIPAVPLPPPVPPRRERAANAALRAMPSRDAADRLVRPETDATVHALLERLERGVVRRNQTVQARGRGRADRGLDDALAALRSLARQA
ncbi:hypothetical protein [Sphingomonas sp. 22176]|uniref:hypothetical protein n=1 Tax=Sphingomonas sp. 22176 TaxID=3453884 RepID=UPI003F865A77